MFYIFLLAGRVETKEPLWLYRSVILRDDAHLVANLKGFTSFSFDLLAALQISLDHIKAANFMATLRQSKWPGRIVILRVNIPKGTPTIPLLLCSSFLEKEVVLACEADLKPVGKPENAQDLRKLYKEHQDMPQPIPEDSILPPNVTIRNFKLQNFKPLPDAFPDISIQGAGDANWRDIAISVVTRRLLSGMSIYDDKNAVEYWKQCDGWRKRNGDPISSDMSHAAKRHRLRKWQSFTSHEHSHVGSSTLLKTTT